MTLFWKNFTYLCRLQGVSPSKWASEHGFSSGMVSFWKNGTIPHTKKLRFIADNFNVSENDILNIDMEERNIAPCIDEAKKRIADIKKDNEKEKGDNTITALSPKEKELLALVKRMSDSEIEQLRDFIYELYSKG